MGIINLHDNYEISSTISETTISSSSSMSSVKLPEGYVKEKVKVDRRKLEAMILRCPPDPWDTQVMRIPISEDGRVMSIDEFFQKIMDFTNTEIRYPKFLEIGARNKKDPQVHVIGLPKNVTQACQMVSVELMPQMRIQMKMDVPHTYHSHIIGKGGCNVQSITKRTGVKIHFPDANKISDTPKSNQVTITSRGLDMNGLESARAAIREHMPLIFSFEVRLSSDYISQRAIEPENRAYIKTEIESTYQVQVTFIVVLDDLLQTSVKGLESDHERVIEATQIVLNSVCGNIGIRWPVQASYDYSVRNKSFILGVKGSNIARITSTTATQVILDDNTNCLSLIGDINNVYAGLQKVVGSQPILLTFDLPPDIPPENALIHQLRTAYNVFIDTSETFADGRYNVKIRSEERNAKNVYEAWRLMSKTQCNPPYMKIPHHYEVKDTKPFPLLMSPPTQTIPETIARLENLPKLNDNCLPGFDQPPAYLGGCGTSTSQPDLTTLLNELQISPPQGQIDPAQSGTFGPGFELKESAEFLKNSADRPIGYERKFGDYLTKKSLAMKLMKDPITSDPRTPTVRWSGLGLSKSGPAYILPQSVLQNSTSSESSSTGLNYSSDAGRELSTTTYGPFGNQLRSVLPTPSPSPTNDSVVKLLTDLNLEQYIDHFVANEIDLGLLRQLTDHDLKELGMNVFGHRKKLLLCIKNLAVDEYDWISK